MKNLGKLLMCTLVALPLTLQALSLSEAREWARSNYPAIRQYALIEQSRDFTLSNAAKGWLPRVSVSASAMGFTDILKSTPQAQAMSMDLKNGMANAAVSVTQTLYDGGQIQAQKAVATAQSEVQRQQLEVSMYGVRERVDQIFFAILLLDEQLKQNDLLANDLHTSEQTIESLLKSGMANQGDLEAIQVEQLKVKQQNEALQASRSAYLRMLSVFVGKELSEMEQLEKPEAVKATGLKRPELNYYAAQQALIAAQRKQLNTQLRPTLGFFGTGLIHSKVSEWINQGMLMGGVSLTWNLSALYTRKNDLRKLNTQTSLYESQQEVFVFNNRLQNEEAEGAINSLRKQLAQDDEIVRLRQSIRNRNEQKVKLGTESVNELLRNINAVSQARAQQALHELQLLKEQYNQNDINGL